MAVVIASDLGKDIAGSPLLRGVSFKLERGDRMTLSGRNGSGKTTLLRMLAGDASIDRGKLRLQKGAKVALYDQRPPRERDLTLRDYVLSGAKQIVAVEQELARLEGAMADGAHDEATLGAYAAAQGLLEGHGGYRWRDRALITLHGLGFRDEDLDRSLSSFSGGELTRGSLARVLTGEPDLILLDEPTNHLDIASLEWLEQHLAGLDAAIVLVAHDRWFLEAVGTSVLELEAGRARFFKGPWHAWRKEQAARELALGRAIERQQAEIERLERFVERFRAKATKARQAQSRVKRLDKMQRVDRDPRDDRSLSFTFKEPERSGRVVFELEGGRLEVPGRVLLEDAELWLERGEHVTLVGSNGTGKTTLIEALAGRRPLAAGKLRTGHNVAVGYVSQHAEELSGQGTLLEAAQRATGLTPGKTRALLGRFLFSGEEAQKPVGGLSGGELRRLSLAVLVNSGANMLVLDEPTNHLDVDSREALEDALRGFPGSLLLVSHDRALLDAVGTRTLALEDGELRSYDGGWAEYVQAREARRSAEAGAGTESPRPAGRKSKRAQPESTSRSGTGPEPNGRPKPSKNAQRAQRALERELEGAEAALRALEDELADPAAWADPARSATSTERHAKAKRAVEELYSRWEAVAG
ncbi:MAG: ABC-F family ATP-binding cassette domain-containing protein [Thermoleophilaceae bacterium]|nr:ABC-F family ATP-binding cassette domain-containing protein [Thermoleophilaceae bacterium]